MDKETIEKFDLRQFVKSWLLPLAAEIAILLVIFNFVINITYVPTGSMIPTISEHSVLISLREYNTDELQRGEIYSFHSDELGKTLIKRLIGLPGETVRIEGNGNIYINDVRLDEPYVKNQEYGYTGTFEVPEGCYFFLGDNRSGSSDARYWDNPYIQRPGFRQPAAALQPGRRRIHRDRAQFQPEPERCGRRRRCRRR